MAGVSDTGFTSKTFVDIVDEITARANTAEFFGESFASGPNTTFGVQTGVLSSSILDIWNLAQAVTDAQNRDTATGIYLDYLAAIIGLERLTAAGSTGNLLFTGTNGTIIPQFFPVSDIDNRNVTTDEEFQLNRTLSYQSTFSVNTVADLTNYTIIVNGSTFTIQSDSDATEPEILNALDLAITSPDVTTAVVGTTLVITNVNLLNTISTSNSSNLTLDSMGVLVAATAATTGALAFPANTLTTLVGVVGGLSSVDNLSAFVLGRDAETDEELRDRMAERGESTGTATKPSIETSVAEVTGVTAVFIQENIDIITDPVTGVPPKAYETFVTGGANDDIGNVIWDTKPAGIETHGDITVVIIDQNGDEQSVEFSRLTDVFAHMRVTYSFNTEETFPADGEASMAAAVVVFGGQLSSGEDYEPTKFFQPLYTVPGTFITLIEIDITPNAGDTPTFVTVRIPVAQTENLNFDASRISFIVV